MGEGDSYERVRVRVRVVRESLQKSVVCAVAKGRLLRGFAAMTKEMMTASGCCFRSCCDYLPSLVTRVESLMLVLLWMRWDE